MSESTPNQPTFVFDDLPLHWQMTRAEKYAFVSLLEYARPETAIEIGTYRGGSLQVLSKLAGRVISIDISPDCRSQLSDRFVNVEFLAGKSRDVLPGVLERIRENGESLGFVLIDGDHSADGVRDDINLVLGHVPSRPVYVVFHDSFNPDCRRGILAADWKQCPHVHYVEVDFIPGVYHFNRFDTALPRSMWGGLAVAVMLPEARAGDLTIHQSQEGLFKTVRNSSRLSPAKHFHAMLDKISRALHR